MKKFKALVALSLAAVMAFSACGTPGADATDAGAGAAATDAGAAAPATVEPGEIYRGPRLRAGPGGDAPTLEEIHRANNLPIVYPPGSQTLTIYQRLSLRVDDLSREGNAFTRYIEEATGLRLEFVTAPQNPDDERTVRNMMLAAGNFPCVLSIRGMPQNEMAMLAHDGILVPLDHYIEIWGVNTRDAFERYPASRMIVTGISGNIYSLPDINDCFHCIRGEGRIWYHMPWIESMNNGVLPETYYEFVDLLRRIRDENPNGNEAAPEIPIGWRMGNNWRAINWFSNMFQMFPNRGRRLNDDGTVEFLFTNDYFRQTIAFMRDLYAEGLIQEDAFTIDNDSSISLGEDPAGVRFGFIIGWGPEDSVRRGGDRWYQYFVMPPLIGPNGTRYAMSTGSFNAVMPGWFVTENATNVEAAVRLGDLLLDEYFGYTSYIGALGVGWDYAAPGDLGLNNLPAVFRELMSWGTQPMNTSWDQASITYRCNDFRLSQYAEGADLIFRYLRGEHDLLDQIIGIGSFNEIFKFYGSYRNLMPFEIPERNIVPPMLFSEEDNRIIADGIAAIEPFVVQRVTEFVTGARNVDTEFDTFVAELENLGLLDVQAALQRSFDAQFGR